MIIYLINDDLRLGHFSSSACPLCHLISYLDQLCPLCISVNLSNTLESGDGGAVSLRLWSSATLFSGCLFSDNFAVNGGAISGDFATAALHSSTMHFNEATGNVSILVAILFEIFYSFCFWLLTYVRLSYFCSVILVGRRCSHARRSTVHVQRVSFFFLIQCRFRW